MSISQHPLVDPDTQLQLAHLAHRYANGIDRRDWAAYEDCFCDPCTFDFSGFSGGISDLTPHDWAERVRLTNGGFDSTQHLICNVVVLAVTAATVDPTAADRQRIDAATIEYELQAQHFFGAATLAALRDAWGVEAVPVRDPNEAWLLLGGHYTADAVRCDDGVWRFRTLQLTVRWTTGDPAAFGLARRRAAEHG